MLGGPDSGILGWQDTSTSLHEERLDAVVDHLLATDVETVLDLGCGSGALIERLVSHSRLRRIVGLDSSPLALLTARQRLADADGTMDQRLSLREGSITGIDEDPEGFDAAVLVETLEHLEPGQLSRLEHSLFARLRPRHVVITTPNHEFNALYGLRPGEYRHPHHRFEWDRPRFERWATGVARRNDYDVAFRGIGPANAWYGSSTQMATFRKLSE